MADLRYTGQAARTNMLGIYVPRTAATLPATATTTYFTVAGGLCLITMLIGEVTTICSGTATTIQWTSTPTTGTAVTFTGTTAVTSKEAGALISMIGPALTTGISVQDAGAVVASAMQGVAVPIGNLGLTTSATNTGATKWRLYYIPLDDGASIVAA